MDKAWMDMPRNTPDYVEGVKGFIDYAFSRSAKGNKILCPCKKCGNCYWKDANTIYVHLICEGFKHGYKRWMFHGEASTSYAHLNRQEGVQVEDEMLEGQDDMPEMLRDMACGLDEMGDFGGSDGAAAADANGGVEDFYKLLDDASQELYPGCEAFSKLNFLVRLLHTKFLGGWSDKSFDMLLDLLREAFPQGSKLPKNFYEAKKIVKCLGLGYISIHACDNGCILFWKEHENLSRCPKCNTSRWRIERKSLDGKRVHKVPKKVLRYFPIKERLQRLFINPEMASNMRWHEEGRTKDGLLRHPADAPAWKDFDNKYPAFSAESRNIKLALATDGFNPFRSLNTSYSIWPIVLIPYNLPPWMCMKQPNFILSLLIPGPKAVGQNLDVYMEPLIDDMEFLWHEGIRTYDASKHEFFQLHAAIFGTITDLPGLGYVHGCAISGEVACPDCHSETCTIRLSKGGKNCYMGHRRFLDANHRFRSDANSFDGTTEFRARPYPLSGEDVLKQTEIIRGKRKRGEPAILWKKRSILFRLPYWKDLLLRYNFDVMHIEKNVCDNIVNTLLGIDGKTKDNLNTRLDLQLLGIRKDLHPVDVDGVLTLPPAPYTMNSDERKRFCEVLKGVKFPDCYASDIRSRVHVQEKKLVGLKSHENHILVQHLLPLATRNILPDRVTAVLTRVSNFFKQIYSPVVRIRDMQKLEAEIAETLCILETIFPPSFFDVMIHLMVHLPAQVRIGGPSLYRNMYPMERFLMRLKGYVRTRSHPEGSIAESYIFDESLTFCSQYLHGCETRYTRKARNDDGSRDRNHINMPYFSKNIGRPLVGKCAQTLKHQAWQQAHKYILYNYDHIEPFLQKHLEYLSSSGVPNRKINRVHHETFHEWFRLHVADLLMRDEQVIDELQTLAKGPLLVAKKYTSYAINGYNFHTKNYDEGRSVQSSGVAVVAQSSSYAANSGSPSVESKTYYGIITEILELDYHRKGKIVLFKCDWVDNRVQDKWVKVDKFGIINVNFKHLFNTGEKSMDEPFILASQATQVYYVPDPKDKDWCAVIHTKPRDFYDMDEVESEYGNELLDPFPNMNPDANINLIGDGTCVRDDIEGTRVDPNIGNGQGGNGKRRRKK